jgi:Zn-finger nucleic acid-binding protein
MNCPGCNTTLLITDRQGIEIDYCPQCRGVWLDRGELDKIVERSAAETPWHKYTDDDDDERYRSGPQGSKKRKKSFLGELFDLD